MNRYSVWAIMPNGLKREAYNISQIEVLPKLLEYRNAGALKRGYKRLPEHKRTKWGKVDYRT